MVTPARPSAGIDVLDRTAEDRAVATLTLAFANDPLMRWAFPDPHQYLAHFPEFIRAFASPAFDHGSGFAVDDLLGVALWLPPGVQFDEEEVGAVFDRGVRDEDKEAVFSLLDQVGSYHPEGVHWYLPVIGVDPGSQGRGYGSVLLAHALALCDQEHLPAYLESSNERNIPLYERHGFKVMDRLQAGGSPGLWPMLREPR